MRVIAPVERTDAVRELLVAAPGATHVADQVAFIHSLVGVFIPVTTVPAAAFTSMAVVEGRYLQALESAAQLAINLVGIVVAAVAVLLLWRPSHPRGGSRRLSAG